MYFTNVVTMIRNRMQILICHNDYGRFSGEENAIETMSEVLQRNGHEVRWFRRSSEEIGESLTKKAHALFAGIYSFRSSKDIAGSLDREVIDLVQVQNLYPFLSPSILRACKKRGLPVVMRCPNYRLFCPNGLHLSHGKICERCLGPGRELHCIVRNCEDNILKSAGYAARNAFARLSGMILHNVDFFLVLSEFQKQRFVAGGVPIEKLAVLPNIAPVLEKSREGIMGDCVSFVGRVSLEKGIREFLEAARRLPKIKFCVAGHVDKNMHHFLTKAPANVECTGFLSGSALDDLYDRSRILVFPSVWFEGFPNVIAKAMAHGKPVIGSNVGAIPEIIDDGITGLLFDPGGARDLSDKIRTLWDDEDRCRNLGVAGYKKARNEYSEKRYYQRLIDVYTKALQLRQESEIQIS